MKQRRVYIYRECDQPEVGWFKSCFVCYTITGQTVLYDEIIEKNRKIERLVYVCPECKRVLQKDDILRSEYERAVNNALNTC